jgi:hypothetical protein
MNVTGRCRDLLKVILRADQPVQHCLSRRTLLQPDVLFRLQTSRYSTACRDARCCSRMFFSTTDQPRQHGLLRSTLLQPDDLDRLRTSRYSTACRDARCCSRMFWIACGPAGTAQLVATHVVATWYFGSPADQPVQHGLSQGTSLQPTVSVRLQPSRYSTARHVTREKCLTHSLAR